MTKKNDFLGNISRENVDHNYLRENNTRNKFFQSDFSKENEKQLFVGNFSFGLCFERKWKKKKFGVNFLGKNENISVSQFIKEKKEKKNILGQLIERKRRKKNLKTIFGRK